MSTFSGETLTVIDGEANALGCFEQWETWNHICDEINNILCVTA